MFQLVNALDDTWLFTHLDALADDETPCGQAMMVGTWLRYRRFGADASGLAIADAATNGTADPEFSAIVTWARGLSDDVISELVSSAWILLSDVTQDVEAWIGAGYVAVARQALLARENLGLVLDVLALTDTDDATHDDLREAVYDEDKTVKTALTAYQTAQIAALVEANETLLRGGVVDPGWWNSSPAAFSA